MTVRDPSFTSTLLSIEKSWSSVTYEVDNSCLLLKKIEKQIYVLFLVYLTEHINLKDVINL